MSAYLDHAATTPMMPAAATAMATAASLAGNPSSLHSAGRRARRLVEEAREQVAEAVGSRPGEVIFTAGGTEADNLAVKGLYWARNAAGTARPRILVSAVEHHAVLDPADWLGERQGAQVSTIGVDAVGRIRLDELAAQIAADPDAVALISVMLANNEMGTIQPVRDVVALAREHGIPVHVDAVQAFGHLSVDFAGLDVDALTLSAHKIGGPHGMGALIARRGLTLETVLHGGGQERSVRSGTLNTPGIAAFGVAAQLTAADREVEAARVGALRDQLIKVVQQGAPHAVLRGDPDPAGRLPGNAHFTFAGCEGDSLLYLFDANGVECSTGSACQAGVPQPSHVLMAMGIEPADARCAVRFSLGRTSTQADVEAVAAALGPVMERASRAGLSVPR